MRLTNRSGWRLNLLEYLCRNRHSAAYILTSGLTPLSIKSMTAFNDGLSKPVLRIEEIDETASKGSEGGEEDIGGNEIGGPFGGLLEDEKGLGIEFIEC